MHHLQIKTDILQFAPPKLFEYMSRRRCGELFPEAGMLGAKGRDEIVPTHRYSGFWIENRTRDMIAGKVIAGLPVHQQRVGWDVVLLAQDVDCRPVLLELREDASSRNKRVPSVRRCHDATTAGLCQQARDSASSRSLWDVSRNIWERVTQTRSAIDG